MSAQQAVHVIAATVGFISLFLLWVAIIWGMVLRNGWASTKIRHSTAYGIHMTLALLGLCLGFVHGFAQLAAPGTHVRLIDQFIPFINPADPIGIGAGLLGLQLMTAAAMSVVIQKKLGYSRWRALHAITYVAFMLVVGHVLISGSDMAPPYAWGSVLAAWLTTVALWATSTPWFGTARRQAGERLLSRRRGMDVVVNVDAFKCAQFGFCEHEAPDVFRLRTDGRLSYSSVVPGDRAEAVLRAAEVCPARAIMLNQMPTDILTKQPPPPDPEPVPPSPRRGMREPTQLPTELNGNRPTSISGTHRHGRTRGGGPA